MILIYINDTLIIMIHLSNNDTLNNDALIIMIHLPNNDTLMIRIMIHLSNNDTLIE